MEIVRLIVPEEMDDTRIDRVIASLMNDQFSRTRIKQLITDGAVKCNGVTVKKASVIVRIEDELLLDLPEKTAPDIVPEAIPLDILYEDEDLLVVNKPKGMVVHPAAGHMSGTLVNAVLYHCEASLSGIGGVTRPGIVHRIDKDTTGSLIVCKNDIAHLSIAAQLKAHSVDRIYEAIVHGVIRDEGGSVNAPIGRSRFDRKKMAAGVPDGKSAVTHYRVLKRFESDALTHIACRLESGRTHQIRVHMASVHHPVMGDALYAPGYKSRYHTTGQCLHARTIAFDHPRTHRRIRVEAPLPDYFTHLLRVMR